MSKSVQTVQKCPICPHGSKSVQKDRERSKSIQKCPKVSKSVQSVQKRPNCPKASKSVQKRPKCPKGSKSINGVQNCQEVSKITKRAQSKKTYCCFFWDILHLTFLCHIHHITNIYHSSAFWRSIPVALFFAFAIQSQQISYKSGIFGSSHFPGPCSRPPVPHHRQVVHQVPKFVYQYKKDSMCWFILQVD